MGESNEELFKGIASQLRQPEGEDGIRTGMRMQESNDNMIRSAIASLELQAGDTILEIGPGNGYHLSYIFEELPDVRYTGVDFSATMVEEATRKNRAYPQAGFVLTDGELIPFPDNTFNKLFTVNTLYFWRDPKAYLLEIYRVLQPGGQCCIAFATKDFMQQLPFTAYGFELYSTKSVQELVDRTPFETVRVVSKTERILGNTGEYVDRDFVLFTVVK